MKGGTTFMNKLQQLTQVTGRKERSAGFTIIEVVLVLAIAGLIFLMVFIALPSLQRSQRDTQRKDDLSRIQTQITSYSNNNRGAVPTDLTTGAKSFVKNYLGGTSNTVAGTDYVDPTTGTGYTFKAAGTQPTAVGQIGYDPGHICGTDGAFATGTARQYAIEIMLEGQTVPYCVDSR
jgi:prepilin-type N-terminal cleavage/methylation domain-containing protein